MKTGEILHRFKAKDGREVILRTPRWEDLDDFVELINSLVDEGADIVTNRKVTRGEEADWLGRRLAILEKNEGLNLVAEVDGKVIANSTLEKGKGITSHVGEIGIIVIKGYRNIGIGTEMLKTLIIQAKKWISRFCFSGSFPQTSWLITSMRKLALRRLDGDQNSSTKTVNIQTM